jgi:hypothetical protein
VAAHPLYPRENAAAELVLDGGVPVVEWELVETTPPHHEGCVVEVRVGSFGATVSLCPGMNEELPDDMFRGPSPRFREVDGGELGTLVMFSVGPQHQDCRTFAGRSADRIVRSSPTWGCWTSTPGRGLALVGAHAGTVRWPGTSATGRDPRMEVHSDREPALRGSS